MFIWDFVAETVLGQIIDWIYGQIVGFLGDFFMQMGSMGADLFEMTRVQSIVLFFSYLAWALYATGLVVAVFECGIEYQTGRGSVKETSLNAIKGFMAVGLFITVPVELYKLCVSLQGSFTVGITGLGEDFGTVDSGFITSLQDAGTWEQAANAGVLGGLNSITSPTLMIFILILMGYAVIKVFFANLKRCGILLIQIAVGSLHTRHVTPVEEKKIISNAANKNRMDRSNTNDLQQTVLAESNLQDVTTIVLQMHRNREPLLYAVVYLELCAHNLDQLKLLQTELIRSKLNVDRLMLRQQQGFQCVMPTGWNLFRDQFERVLPASSVANLYPFNYSGKTDPQGFYVGRDKFGSNVLMDFNRRADDKTNANILVLGNSGQGKSYLLKLILTNPRESGMRITALDPEIEYEDLTNNLGGCFIDLMSGEYILNFLEPKTWDDSGSPEDLDAPQTFRIEIMLQKLYAKWNLSDQTDFTRLGPTDYPIPSDLYALIEGEYKGFDESKRQLYTAEMLQSILLGLSSMCVGAESKFFNGHTNITDSRFVTFGVKGLLQASRSLKNALLFNVLSFMSDELLTEGNTAASLDEFYLFLSNLTAVEYVRNFMKRVRKKDSAVIIARQNLEDFNLDGIKEYTKPLFSIPTHQFLFNAGSIDARFYTDTLQLEESEYNLIRYPQRGVCLYKCGNERYNLMVNAPEHKAKLFGNAGGH